MNILSLLCLCQKILPLSVKIYELENLIEAIGYTIHIRSIQQKSRLLYLYFTCSGGVFDIAEKFVKSIDRVGITG